MRPYSIISDHRFVRPNQIIKLTLRKKGEMICNLNKLFEAIVPHERDEFCLRFTWEISALLLKRDWGTKILGTRLRNLKQTWQRNLSVEKQYPSNRAEVFLRKKFPAGSRDSGRKRRNLGNRARPPAHVNTSRVFEGIKGCAEISETCPARWTGLIWRGPVWDQLQRGDSSVWNAKRKRRRNGWHLRPRTWLVCHAFRTCEPVHVIFAATPPFAKRLIQ